MYAWGNKVIVTPSYLFCYSHVSSICRMFSVPVYDSVSYVLFLHHLLKFLIPTITLAHINCCEHDMT